MNPGHVVASTLKILEKYLDLLSGMDEEEFQRTPAEGVWSYSEVCSHIIYVNKSSLVAIERCVYGNKSSSGSLSWRAWIVLFFGRIPWKTKAPDKIAAMVQKISLEDAGNEIIKFQENLPELITPIINASRKQKLKHPRLGMLNARQWLRFIEVHTLHHLKQLKRISSMLNHAVTPF